MRYLFILLLFPCFVAAQNTIGLPDIINYSKLSYGAGLQNWNISQDKNGIIYIANNEGLLSFDGHYWSLYPLPNKTIVRSIAVGSDNNLYVGGQDELGYFAPADNGRLQYHNLVNLIPAADRSFGDVWNICQDGNSFFFRCNYKIFKLTNQAITVYPPPFEWAYMGISNGVLYAQDFKKGLLFFDKDKWSLLPLTNTVLVTDGITSILPAQKNNSIVTTLKNGIYLLSKTELTKITTATTAIIEKERIYAATKISDDWIALATTNGGVHIIDTKGELIQSFSKIEGIQNNNVLSIFLDNQSNLWLGLDDGIDCVAYNKAIKRINPNLLDASGYTAIIHNDRLYTGTSIGLFSVPLQPNKDLSFSKGVFTAVDNAMGQIWGLAEINGKLLLGQHEGAFVVNDNKASAINTNPGFWNFIPLSDSPVNSRIVAGHYSGVSFFDYKGQNFSAGDDIPDFNESSRFIAIDRSKNIWVSHPYHGVYKISKGDDGVYHSVLFTVKNGLPSTLNNHVYKIRNEVVVATETGVFSYNETTNTFEPSAYFKNLLGQQSIRYLKEDTRGNIWFIHEKNLGVIDMSGNKPMIIYLTELNNKMLSGFEFIYAVDDNNIFISGEKGFFHINYEKYKKAVSALPLHLRAVRILDKKDSLIFGGYFNRVNEQQVQDENKILQIDNNWKTIHFEFSSPLFGQQTNLEYSYWLKGFSDDWSDWSTKTEKEFTNLPAGKYQFEIKVRNNLGNESVPISYSFIILPPWYKTYWAYAFYLLLFGLIIYFLYKSDQRKFLIQQEKYEEEQKRLQYLHQLEMNKSENELVALRNEKLNAEINFKNSELATTAMHLVQKGELLTKMKTELNQVMKMLDNEKSVNELRKIIKVLTEDDKTDKDWEHFAQHFDKVHNDFVIRLKEKHPTLSGNEMKLSAYLRMNLSTKEIAQLMNISVRGVEISRYRLRKKLGIASEVSLFEYLLNIQ